MGMGREEVGRVGTYNTLKSPATKEYKEMTRQLALEAG